MKNIGNDIVKVLCIIYIYIYVCICIVNHPQFCHFHGRHENVIELPWVGVSLRKDVLAKLWISTQTTCGDGSDDVIWRFPKMGVPNT